MPTDSPKPLSRHQLGKQGEVIATQYLSQKGYRIIATNWRCGRYGEVDCIATLSNPHQEENLLVFVEVKTAKAVSKKTGQAHHPAEWVTPQKRTQIIRLAEQFIHASPDLESNFAIRFDVIAVWLNNSTLQLVELQHLENAFGHE